MGWRDNYNFTPVNIAFNDLYNALKERDIAGVLTAKPGALTKCALVFIDNEIFNLTGSSLYTAPADNGTGETSQPGGFLDITNTSKLAFIGFNKLLSKVADSETAIEMKTFFDLDLYYPIEWLTQRIAMINLLRYFHPASITYKATYYKYKMWFRSSGSTFRITESEVLEDADETTAEKYAYYSIILGGKVTTSRLSRDTMHYPGTIAPEFYITITIPKRLEIITSVPAFPALKICAYAGNNSDYSGNVTGSVPTSAYGVYNFPLPFTLDTENPYFNFSTSETLEFDAYKNTFNAIIEFLYTLHSEYDVKGLNRDLDVKLDYPGLDLYDILEYK